LNWLPPSRECTRFAAEVSCEDIVTSLRAKGGLSGGGGDSHEKNARRDAGIAAWKGCATIRREA
jgi:hypothetical protein